MESEKAQLKAGEKLSEKEIEVATAIPLEKAQPGQPAHEREKGSEIKKPSKPSSTDTPDPPIEVASTIDNEKTTAVIGASSGGPGGFVLQTPIGPKVTIGDLYYKTYIEELRGNAPHQAPWGLKQKDTFKDFSSYRKWFVNSFTPGEVNRQRARTHDELYQAYVVGEANTRAANHQIVREWRTMVKERADWEKYRDSLMKEMKSYEIAKAAFAEEKAKFESDRKSEEWGREGPRGKLRIAEELSSKERVEFKKICEKDNQRAYAARNKITELEGKIVELTGKVEDAQASKEMLRFVELAEVKAQLSGRDKDLTARDVEIAELKRRLREQVDKSESLEIDLEAERSKTVSAEEARQKAEEARAISSTPLNVAQNNYAEVQGIVDTLSSEAEWLRGRGVCLVCSIRLTFVC
ncbi:hypothetical protein HanOQP8_Chr17g0661071 [Helianthus annuus]|nr:hypothetical protein HanHA89_Chr17g0707351 [Helianthus annuus]KAJ0636363.1 hypothetical protein HanOQP8_Chr17g0661071 [Helianthus annuus]